MRSELECHTSTGAGPHASYIKYVLFLKLIKGTYLHEHRAQRTFLRTCDAERISIRTGELFYFFTQSIAEKSWKQSPSANGAPLGKRSSLHGSIELQHLYMSSSRRSGRPLPPWP